MSTIVTRSGKGYPLTWDEMDTNLTNLNYGSFTSVKDSSFGAVGDGITDDTAAIQAAIDTGKNIYFPDGKYLITNTLTVSTNGQGFYGNAGSVGGKADNTGNDYGAIIQFSKPDASFSTPMVLITISQVTFNCLKFRGDSTSVADVGLKFEKITNTDDMDGYVFDCEFYNLSKPIYFYGRALHADKNVFSSLSSGDSITLDWPATGTSGDEVQIGDSYKGRAQKITNNRFHGGRYAVLVKNYTQRSPIYANNTIDVGQGFLEIDGGAGLNGAVIDGNIADLCVKAPIRFKALSTCIDTVISNNKLGGAIAGNVDGNDMRPFSSILWDGPATVDSVLITGNTLCGTDAFGVAIINDSASPAITVKNLNVQNNLISNIGLDGSANRAIIYSIFDVDQFIFSGNTISNMGATVVSAIRTNSKTINGSVLRGNTFDVAKTLTTTTTLAGTQDSASVVSGTYTPVQVSTNTNVDAVTFYDCQYLRVGDTATVSGQVAIDATAIGDTLVKFSLPIASNLTASYQCSGMATQNGYALLPSVIGGIYGDATNDCAVLRLNSPINSIVGYCFQLTYRVI